MYFIIAVIIVLLTLFGAVIGNESTLSSQNTSRHMQQNVFYSNRSDIEKAVLSDIEHYKAANFEQGLVEICRSLYYTARKNGCSNVNEEFVWRWLLQSGNAGLLTTALAQPSSSSFDCATPERYGVYLLKSTFSSAELAGYSYNLNFYDSASQTIRQIGGSADPCAYADIVQQ